MTFNAVLIRLFLAFALSATSGTLSAQIMIDPEEAFKVARTTQKPVLLIFSGSDWCVPCIRFDREILADSTFLRYAKGHIILLKADFPQRSKVSPPLKSAYETLADQFNKEGTFPKLILITPTQKLLATLTTVKQTPDSFIARLDAILMHPVN